MSAAQRILRIQSANGAKSKMINNTYDQEGYAKRQKLSNPNMISRQYAGFQNPRIVRVSQAFGGKDRHSKVWTVKGVRDRRIRLSIPTAIQLYHLQDQLGLTQPSKVIDWLLDVTKDDIDKLPPLQMAPEDFKRFHLPPTIVPHNFNSTQLSISPFYNSTPNNDHQRMEGKEAILSFSPFFNTPSYAHQRTEGKDVIIENKWNSYNYQDSDQQFSNLSLSRSDKKLDTYTSLFPSSSAPPFEPQIFSCFSSPASPSFFPPYVMPFELLSSSSPCVPPNSLVPVPLNLIDTQVKVPFGLNMNSKISSQSNNNNG
ncbi:unnamed protein product [Lactuca virosa]|uniref:TCP domain-containing protein n=1 Tax=Lactuca virosa TaxID=75947 RepID=A0AAU9MNX8_9ASTR|nr:unnamed protein product [Lactuca virosa]